VILWRISRHISLSGDGSLRASGRWHTRGRRVVYCAENPAAALLETLVHFEIDLRDLPAGHQPLEIRAPDDLAVREVEFRRLTPGWPERLETTRAIGDRWLATRSSALLRVPSAVAPDTYNVLLNPVHQDASRIRIARVAEYVIDPRLLKRIVSER
jgi:RES domain-containing protein